MDNRLKRVRLDVIDAIEKRSSIRAFLPNEVSHEIISEILAIASRAPSSKNTQPWHVVAATGQGKQNISEVLLQQLREGTEVHPDLPALKDVPELYKQREFSISTALYGALNIDRADKAKRMQQWEKNYHFFNAPVALIFFTEKFFGESAILDCGMFIQNVMLAAEGFGLATCPQRSISYYPVALKSFLGDQYRDKILLTGMALGYPDPSAPENNYRTERAKVEDFTTFLR